MCYLERGVIGVRHFYHLAGITKVSQMHCASLTLFRYKKVTLMKMPILLFITYQVSTTRMPPVRPDKPALPQPYNPPVRRPR